jgi:hypothetical protein
MTVRAMPSQLRTPTFSFRRTTPGGAQVKQTDSRVRRLPEPGPAL